MMLEIALELECKIYVMEVQTASFNADVEKEAFVKMLPEYERSNKTGVLLVDFAEAPRTGLVRGVSASALSGFSRSSMTHACTFTRKRTAS